MATLLVFDALVSFCVKLSRRRRRVKSRPLCPPENGKIAAQTMAGTVDFDRLEYEKRVNLVIDHVSAHLAEDLSSSPPTSPGTSGSTSWTCREARWRSACSPAPPTRSRTRGARSIGHGCQA